MWKIEKVGKGLQKGISWQSFVHLSSNSSMVRASHRRAEGGSFEYRLGTKIFFQVEHNSKTT